MGIYDIPLMDFVRRASLGGKGTLHISQSFLLYVFKNVTCLIKAFDLVVIFPGNFSPSQDSNTPCSPLSIPFAPSERLPLLVSALKDHDAHVAYHALFPSHCNTP